MKMGKQSKVMENSAEENDWFIYWNHLRKYDGLCDFRSWHRMAGVQQQTAELSEMSRVHATSLQSGYGQLMS